MTCKRTIHGLAIAMLGAAALFAAPRASIAADIREAGKAIVDKNQQAIVTVRVTNTIKFSSGGQDAPPQDRKIETNGTVLSPDGLTLVPLLAIDPAASMRRAGGDNDMKVDAQVKDIKIVLANGKEVPATVVSRDSDFDIAFIYPTTKPSEPMKCIDLGAVADAGILEQVMVLTRAGRSADRAIEAMTGEVQAIVTKPRKFYIPSAELSSGGLGVPIFNADSKLVGFVMLRVVPGSGADDVQSLMGEGGGAMPIIMPASQIAEAAKQAQPPAAKK